MDIDNVAHLELVADDFEEGEHKKLDDNILRELPVSEFTAPLILTILVSHSGGRLLPRYQDVPECETLLRNNSVIKNMILDGPKEGFRQLRLPKLLRPDPPSIVDKYSRDSLVIARCWEEMYAGEAADALWAHIQSCFYMDPQSSSSRRFCVKSTAIVQSSGMGKSRTVDQLSRFHFVIPVNFREPQSSGFPPRDKPACDYLFNSQTQLDAFLRSCSFLHALFHQTTIVVRAMKKGAATESFRNRMKDGMHYRGHGEWRTKFYQAVETNAKEVYSAYAQYFPKEAPSTLEVDRRLCSGIFPLRKIFRGLCEALEDQSAGEQPLKQQIDPESPWSQHPCVVVAFDEVHILAMSPQNEKWSRFDEIRRAIRGLMDESLFTLFLSASGSLFSIAPTPLEKPGPSARFIRQRNAMLPFYELGFDQLAALVDFTETVDLSQVTATEHFTSYGRPLWRPYYRSPEKSHIFEFAAAKLLGGIPYRGQTLSPEQKLACFAQRIPIEFLSARYASQISDAEKVQVHSHMRVILKVDDELKTMVTMSPSEPILSEAAYFIMTTQSREIFDPPQTLKEIVKGFAVYKDNLEELMVALLFTMARDKAVGPASGYGPPFDGHRWCSLTGLLTSLFVTPPSPSNNHVDVITAHGWRFTPNGTEPLESTLADTFEDSKVYFTHFVEVHEHAIIELDFLMHLMVRGAAILCASDQPDINGIIPFLLRGDQINRGNIGVIMFQVKNDTGYTDCPRADLVRKMSPHGSGITDLLADVPVIRIFFAFAANSPTLKLVNHEPLNTAVHSYSAYDFWVSGLSREVLVAAQNPDSEAAWQDMLRASQGWRDIYAGGGSLYEGIRKSMSPGVAVGREFWGNWSKNVPS